MLCQLHFVPQLAGMQQASETTEKRRSVVVQKTKICNYGQARYELANALSGVDGYDLTKDFKNTIRLLPSTYSADQYTRFLDDWGTVSIIAINLSCKMPRCTDLYTPKWLIFLLQHILETVSVGTRQINRSEASYTQVYKFLSEQVSNRTILIIDEHNCCG